MSLDFLVVFFVIAALTTEMGAAQPEVEQTIRERTGKQIEWRKDPAMDDQVAHHIRALVHRPLTADAAVQVALLNRELQATFEDIGIANADLIEAGLLKNPTFAISARFPDRPPSATNVEMSIAEDFFDVLLIPLRKKVAASELARTKLRVGDEILKLAAEVKTAFCEMQAQQQLLERLLAINETEAAALALSIRQHEAGNIPDLDLANQQATYSQMKLDANQVRTAISSSREKLNRLMGLWGDDTDWKILGELAVVPAHDFSRRGLESIAMSQRLKPNKRAPYPPGSAAAIVMSPDVTCTVTSQRLPSPRGKSILCKSWPLSPTIAPTSLAIFPFKVSPRTRNASPRAMERRAFPFNTWASAEKYGPSHRP